MPQPNEVADVWKHMDFLWMCGRPTYQFGVFYRTGDFDSCEKQFEDVKTCIMAKLSNDREEAVKMMEAMSYKQTKGAKNPTNAIWQLKDVPSWEKDAPKGTAEEGKR